MKEKQRRLVSPGPRRAVAAAVAALTLLIALLTPARTAGSAAVLEAASTLFPAPAAPTPANPTTATIMVGPLALFSVGSLPGQPAAARAAAINRRIASFVNHPERIAPVVVEIRGRERILRMAGRDLLTVTPQDAADNLTTVPELADSWQRELNESLSTVRAEHQTFWIQIRDSIFLSAQSLAWQGAAFIPRLVSALLVLLITLLIARGVGLGISRVLRRSHLDGNTQQLVRTLGYYGIWTLGWIVALGTAGITLTTLVAGLGVTSIALGFALKDLLSNFVSGFLILTTRPFNLGDQIAMTNYEGTVERIELRATHLRTYDNRLIIIPNSDLYIATITNNTASPYRRQEFIVGIGYEADLRQAFDVAQRAAHETPGVLPDPPPDVLLDELARSSVNLKIRFHTDSRRGNATTVSSQVKQRVKEAFEAAGIAIYPSGPQVVQLQSEPAPAPSRTGASDSTAGPAPDAAAPDGDRRKTASPPAAPAPRARASGPGPEASAPGDRP